jgi:hypothetical protein
MSQIYKSISSGPVPPTIVETLTGNTGGAVGPTGNNINVIGTSPIFVTGTPGTSTLTITDTGAAPNYTNVVGPTTYVVLTTDYYISCNTTAGAITLQFPNAPTFKQVWIVKDRTGNATVNHISITTVGGTVTIDGETTYTIAGNYGAVNILANSTPAYEVY